MMKIFLYIFTMLTAAGGELLQNYYITCTMPTYQNHIFGIPA